MGKHMDMVSNGIIWWLRFLGYKDSVWFGGQKVNLKETYGKKYQVTMDESFKAERDTESRREEWRYHEIRGKHGMVFPYGWNLPAVAFTSNIIANRFNNRKWEILQNGEDERTVLVPVGELDMVLGAIQPRKRRQLSPEQKLKAVERLKKYAFKQGQNI